MVKTSYLVLGSGALLALLAPPGCGSEGTTDDEELALAIDESGIEARGAGCRWRCLGEARGVFRDCMDAGGERTACKEAAVKSFRSCAETCPDEPRDCREGCRRVAHNLGERCLLAGIAPERCRDLAEHAGRMCLARCADHDPPPCGERCKRLAHALYEACVDRGGSADDCEARARAAGERCMERCRG